MRTESVLEFCEFNFNRPSLTEPHRPNPFNMASELIGKNVRSFIIKSIQCIVEARLGGLPVHTTGKPNGNEWFNIALNEFQDVNLSTKNCLETLVGGDDASTVNLALIKNDWNICCEILIKTNDNEQMNLEYWFIRSRTLNKEINLTKNLDRDTSARLFKSYNEMSILIKSIISLTRATPAYRISRDGQSADSYVVCYRVYKCEASFEQQIKRANLNENEIRCYSDEFKLGSVTTDHNKIDVSLVYRTNLRNYDRSRAGYHLPSNFNHLNRSDSYNNLQNESPDQTSDGGGGLLPVKTDHFTEDDECNEKRKEKHFLPAFAFNQPKVEGILLLSHFYDAPFNRHSIINGY